MCLLTVSKVYNEDNDKSMVAYKWFANRNSCHLVSIHFPRCIYHRKLGVEIICPNVDPIYSSFGLVKYIPAFHAYTNLDDAKKRKLLSPTFSMYKVEISNFTAIGKDIIPSEILPVDVVVGRRMKLLERIV